MKPQFPFKTEYKVTQGYSDNKNNYPNGQHGAWDIVPYENGKPSPSLIYPIFNGSTLSLRDSDAVRGKGIREEVRCDSAFVSYLKSKGVVPANATEVTLEILYWHILEALDFDGTLTQDTPIAKCGNTGNVFSKGKAVPDNMKGVAPYPGLHLHLETLLKSKGVLLNKDKDSKGRIDPKIIFDYKGSKMNQAKVVKSKVDGSIFVAYEMPSMEYLKTKADLEGFEIPNPIPDTDSLR